MSLLSVSRVRRPNAAICGKRCAVAFSLSVVVLAVGLKRSCWLLASVAASDVFHEVVALHGFAHELFGVVETNFGLVHHVCRFGDTWKHFLNARVVGGLQHNSGLSGVHLIDTQRTIVNGVALLSHSVHHKKCLVWFLGVQPILILSLLLLFREKYL